jgi:putative transposase
MARPLRIEYPGAFYHVMHRGNAGSDIFKSIKDRETFLEYIGKAVERYELKIHTYCLMKNHYHILLETPQPNLSQAIKWINVSYATYFNRKRGRSGHLFQGRFKSILVDADEYLKHLSRYIHLNPVRAKLVERCQDYRWSSYPAYGGYINAPEWLEISWLLSLFAKDQKKAKIQYRNFVEQVDITGIENPSDGIMGGLILGDVDFVNWVKDNFLMRVRENKEIPQLKSFLPKLTLENLIADVCGEFGCERETILKKGKKGNLARDLAIYLCREMTGEKGVTLGMYFGGITGAGIIARYNQISKRIESDRSLKRRVNRIKRRIVNN